MMNAAKNLFKFSLAFGLIYYLINSGKLDFNILTEVLKHPEKVIFAALGMFVILCIVNFRYSLILGTKTLKPISKLKLLKYNWIGMFFNSVLPGSVSGDLVKIFYIKEEDKNLTNKFMLGSILIDRILGLFGLVIILGFSTFFNYAQLTSYSQDIKTLLDLNLILFTGVILGLLILKFFPDFPKKALAPFSQLPIISKVLPKLFGIWDSLCELRSNLFTLVALSVLLQGLSIIVLWFLTQSFALGEFPFIYAFSLVPVGFVAIAIPIAPAGLGVGHAIFHTLLGFIGIANGADLFNIYFFMVLAFNLVGSIPYLMTKSKHPSKKQISSQNLNAHNEEI